MNDTIYTIGYAGKDIDTFVNCLKKNGVDCVIDVRSSPFSKTFPMFDKTRLEQTLKKENILYAHFGKEFGARRIEKEAYLLSYNLKGELKEQVSFNEVYKLAAFNEGVERTLSAIKQGYKVCFMCSEKHPVDCHRFWMVAFFFQYKLLKFNIINIISENNNETFEEVLDQVDLEKEQTKFYQLHDELNELSLVKMPVNKWVKLWSDFFSKNDSIIEKKQFFSNIRIGYSKGDNENE